MWLRGSILGIPVIVGVVYLAVSNGQHDGNARIMKCVSTDVQRWAADREVLLMGDFNGHLQALDGFQDFNGDLVELTARELNLEIANLRSDCEGEFTWCARNSHSCIDYVLISPKLSRHVTSITIDEDGKFSVGSDHNPDNTRRPEVVLKWYNRPRTFLDVLDTASGMPEKVVLITSRG
ncbi:uncharacterized protein LOC125756576 [Rhipicephalus sanguineus]|uniref:uncharacterized protein LOC125756576 n=1 Tax=Rhipicephalus sanguineus TaxID=34632 RepID=UPI0020C4DBAE|nr:uncharacterized protein LOC125756576 [Rhipicephalus sanguineus]